MKRLHVLYFFLISITIAACNNYDVEIPEKHDGSNTLSFKVNGTLYETSGTKSSSGPGLNLQSSWVSFSLSADSSYGSFSAVHPDYHLYGQFQGDKGTKRFYFDSGHRDNIANWSVYRTDSLNGGYLQFDVITPTVLAGTFELVVRDGFGKTIHLTEGRFDAKR